jgi:hypothetical protein
LTSDQEARGLLLLASRGLMVLKWFSSLMYMIQVTSENNVRNLLQAKPPTTTLCKTSFENLNF